MLHQFLYFLCTISIISLFYSFVSFSLLVLVKQFLMLLFSHAFYIFRISLYFNHILSIRLYRHLMLLLSSIFLWVKILSSSPIFTSRKSFGIMWRLVYDGQSEVEPRKRKQPKIEIWRVRTVVEFISEVVPSDFFVWTMNSFSWSRLERTVDHWNEFKWSMFILIPTELISS
jgi:hypothetical protein